MKMAKKFVTMLLFLGVLLLGLTLHPTTSVQAARKDGTIKGCTIWLTQATTGYNSTGKRLVTIPKGKKLTVKKLVGKQFVCTYNKKTVYVDSTYVLINVKQYIPSLDIRLDMSQKNNLFNMGGEKISGVSNKRFYTSSGSKKGTAAWVRYSVAKKLLQAQTAFKKDGFGIVIYDAYRPYSVTCAIRDGFSAFLNKKTWTFKAKCFGSLGEGWFLAQNASAHNYGRAVDMSLKHLSTGKLISMPTQMHTLDQRAAYTSWKSSKITAAGNARYLKQKMEAAGFTYLLSEWWHFQDNSCPSGTVIDLAI